MVGLCAAALGKSAIRFLKERIRLDLPYVIKDDVETLQSDVLQELTSRLSTDTRPSLPYHTDLQDGDLFTFLEKHRGSYKPFAIKIPEDENGSPSIEISRQMCQDLIIHVMESERQRIGL